MVVRVIRGGKMLKSSITISGYELLGENGIDGIRYAWKGKDNKQLLESAAFPNHRRNIIDNVCGYTTSVSMGCILKALKMPCSFCRTGNMLMYCNALSSIDIAK